VYKQLDQVPSKRRFERFAEEYGGRDVFSEFLTEHLFEKYDSERFVENCRLAERRWKTHMEQRGRHHALARPVDVDTWMSDLLDRVNLETAYNTYWTKLERFYSWLQLHPGHPHVYNPVLMAAGTYEAAEIVWEEKLSRRQGSQE
jgi:hypothetical protein